MTSVHRATFLLRRPVMVINSKTLVVMVIYSARSMAFLLPLQLVNSVSYVSAMMCPAFVPVDIVKAVDSTRTLRSLLRLLSVVIMTIPLAIVFYRGDLV